MDDHPVSHPCGFCCSIFNSREEKARHNLTHFVPCIRCRLILPTKGLLLKHLHLVHKKTNVRLLDLHQYPDAGNQLVPETSTRLYHLNAGGSFITFVVQFFDVDISAQFTIKGCLLLLKSRCLVALPQSKRGSWSWHHINHLYVYKLLTSPNFSIARTVSVKQGLENVQAFHNKGDYPLFVPPTKTVIKKAFPEVFPKIQKSPTYSRWFQMNHLKN